MDENPSESYFPFDSEVDCGRDGWVNPRRHRNPRSLRIGDGDRDVGSISSFPLDYEVDCGRDGWVNPRRHRNPRSLRIGDGDCDVDYISSAPPSLSTRPLHRSWLVAARTQASLRGGRHPYSRVGRSTAAPPSPPNTDEGIWFHRKPEINRWGNLIGRHCTPPIWPSPKVAGDRDRDVSSISPPDNPHLATTTSALLGHGLAGCVEKTSSPEQEEETCSPLSPLASLPICTADQELWKKCVAEADQWVDEMWSSPDQ